MRKKEYNKDNHEPFYNAADPLPQALMITAVVIGISVTAISLTMFIAMAQKYGTTNWKRVKTKRGESD